MTNYVSSSKGGFQPSSEVKHIARPGDLIEFNRDDLYSHFALCSSPGMVVNVVAETFLSKIAKVELVPFDVVAKGSQAKIYNQDDFALKVFQLEARSPVDVVQSAMSQVGEMLPYELHFRNCEYYCTLWRFGAGFSEQTFPFSGDKYFNLIPDKLIVFPGIECSICKSSPINGMRYICTKCPNFNLCSVCFNANSHAVHNPVIQMALSNKASSLAKEFIRAKADVKMIADGRQTEYLQWLNNPDAQVFLNQYFA